MHLAILFLCVCIANLKWIFSFLFFLSFARVIVDISAHCGRIYGFRNLLLLKRLVPPKTQNVIFGPIPYFIVTVNKHLRKKRERKRVAIASPVWTHKNSLPESPKEGNLSTVGTLVCQLVCPLFALMNWINGDPGPTSYYFYCLHWQDCLLRDLCMRVPELLTSLMKIHEARTYLSNGWWLSGPK